MGRQPCCQKSGLKRGPWTIEEDHKLMTFILSNGIQCWRLVPKLAGLLRCGKSCRLRWINYLRPDLKRGALTEAEEDMIIQLHSRLGNRWSKIAAHFPGRTDNEIKNHWNTRIKKKLKILGVDPTTHKPIEQHENCDTKEEGILQSSSSIEQENMELKLQDTLDLHDYQMSKSEGTFNSGLDEKPNLAHINEKPTCSGTKSTVTNKASPPNIFSVGIGEALSEDFLQELIYSPLPWDAYNHLGEDIL